MKQLIIIGVVVVGSAIAGALYLNQRSVEEAAPSHPGAAIDLKAEASTVPAPRGATSGATGTPPPMRQAPQAVPADPRLAAMQVSADNGLIEFIAGSDGRVIKEIDKDPNSIGFRKPLREYTYSGDKVIALVAYQYFSDHVQVTRTAVAYKPDGSVDEYRETTDHDFGGRGLAK